MPKDSAYPTFVYHRILWWCIYLATITIHPALNPWLPHFDGKIPQEHHHFTWWTQGPGPYLCILAVSFVVIRQVQFGDREWVESIVSLLHLLHHQSLDEVFGSQKTDQKKDLRSKQVFGRLGIGYGYGLNEHGYFTWDAHGCSWMLCFWRTFVLFFFCLF